MTAILVHAVRCLACWVAGHPDRMPLERWMTDGYGRYEVEYVCPRCLKPPRNR